MKEELLNCLADYLPVLVERRKKFDHGSDGTLFRLNYLYVYRLKKKFLCGSGVKCLIHLGKIEPNCF